MSKPRQQRSGFSNAPKSQPRRKKPAQSSADQSNKERQAVALINQGKLQEAEAIYRELISAGTSNHMVYGSLAALCGMQGRFDEPIRLLRRTLELKPNYPEAHNNLGIALKEQGDLTAAIDSYNKALQLKPNYPEAHYNLAIALKKQGDLTAAIDSYNKALQLKPNYPEAYYNLGNALQEQGDLDAAIASYNKALQLKPNHPEAHNNLGVALQEQGKPNTAIASFNKALQLKPNHPDAHYNLGNTLKEQGDLDAAIASYNKALQLKPNNPDAHYNLGNALKEQGNLDAAIASYNKALQLKPNYPEVHNNLGVALQEEGNLDAAIASYNKALQLKPNYPEVHNNLGIALQEEGNLDAAIASYNKALQLKPNYPDAHYNSALAMLLSGDYKSGWESHEWRLKNAKGSKKLDATPKCNQWSGEVALKETNKLLLVGEQGLGDTLQFMRYAIALKNEGTSVAFCAKKKLHSLIQSSGIDPSPLTPEQANKVIEGEWMPLLSAAKHLQVSPSNPIITEPYIQPKDELKMKWTDIFGAKEKPVIGINWRGNRKDANKQDRNIPIQVFRKIVERNKGNLVCLQRGALPSEFEQITFNSNMTQHQLDILRIADSDEPEDFLEYAAIINSCDLVITTASTVAHLAAGTGIPTWVLLPKIPDWRWGLEGDTTFWYPSMRLFRQKEKGNWSEVMERVAEALQEQFGSSTMPADPAPIPHPAIKPKPIQDILAPISLGELIDKITILQIKTQHLQGTALANVNRELEALESSLNKLHINIDPTLIQRLKEINQDLWQIEDDIREQERKKNFGKTFIYLARSVYQKNDHRAATKKEINTSYGSALVEEKSYQQY